VIRSFRDKALERFFATGDGRRLSVQNTKRIANILRALDYASRPEDMNLPGFRFHALGGRDRGRYAVNAETQDGFKRRVADAGLPVREVDHGYCKSIYVQDPDGLLVEFTSDPPEAADIADQQRATAHETLRRWQAGDRQVNNTVRPHR
jgi:plasmid maintenance system killer protein